MQTLEKKTYVYGNNKTFDNITAKQFLQSFLSYEIYGKNIDIKTEHGTVSLRENGRIIIS